VTGPLPSFVVIGAMKTGTTTLARWLAEHPAVAEPGEKEPEFFIDESRWARGLEWYRSLYAGTGPGQVTFDASVRYSAADLADVAAARLATTLPDARLVYVVRDPVARARSQHQHQWRMRRERRSFVEACTLESPYVRDGLYHSIIERYLQHVDPARLLVVRSEDLRSPDGDAWPRILEHIGVGPFSPSGRLSNVSDDKPDVSALGRWVRRQPWVHRLRLPAPLRPLARSLMFRAPTTAPTGDGELAPEVLDAFRRDAERLRAWLGREQPLWPSLGPS